MANLETRSKRASSVGILLISIAAPVLPDGAIGQGDRQHIAVSYSGIAATSPPVSAITVVLQGEILSVPLVLRETLSVPTHKSETLSVPVQRHEVLRC